MLLTKLKIVGIVLVSVGLLGAGAGVVGSAGKAGPGAQTLSVAQASKEDPEKLKEQVKKLQYENGLLRTMLQIEQAESLAMAAALKDEQDALARAEKQAADGATGKDDPAKLKEEIERLKKELEKVRQQLDEQTNEARKKLEKLFLQLTEEATKQRDVAEHQRRIAEDQAAQAQAERARAEKELRKAQAERDEALKQAAADQNMKTSAKNLGDIGIALGKYVEAHKRLPPAAIQSKDGKPLLSWRVALLPHLGHKELYEKFKLDEPWDSAHNQKLLAQMPAIYAPPSSRPTEGKTFYRVFAGKGTAFEDPKGQHPGTIRDGMRNTIFVVEAGASVAWTRPDELTYDGGKELPKLGGLFDSGFHVLLLDGTVRFVTKKFDERILRLAIVPDDDKVFDWSDLNKGP